ncbi:DUF4386 domain-containing protein [Phytohabitans rumicis]|uniref:DUF4386 domain-containing protein n=1 Tax=Phytohabitans rumicis TaxID=1076125 RepID=A0A6V8LLV4_9ACTN|nr:DUF4386 domain-containing protein [Phytohabitans rumicis]GFJ95981.1 hypothetical protein Prum_096230 [Phytohabitans rumicis]
MGGGDPHFWIYDTDPSTYPGQDSGPRSDVQQFRASFADHGRATHYFKAGLYGRAGMSARCDAYLKNIRIYRKWTLPGRWTLVPMAQARATVLARIAGVSYLLVIVGGLFAEGVARGSLIVPGDAAATADAIADGESLWRWGLAVHLVYLIPAVVVNVLVCHLFKPVGPTLARLALVFSLVSVTIEGASLLQLYVPLLMLEEGDALAALDDPQRQALSYLAVRLFSAGFGLALAFFAGFCALIGVLILRSQLVPRVIGALMVAAGGCYFLNTLALVVSPRLSDLIFPAILLPCLLGELSLALWFVVKGVRTNLVAGRGPAHAP